ncbi:tyrosine-type recombinase/integrase [Microbispora sp. CA-102843]|uniref:tyrosine-type recombinase/integrase n=1 Tax=Microbispora sp. CA-102843 TaxID=3239952 RepID=UPI003D945041
MKRGNTWSYVIRVRNPETGESKPKWVSGFATEDDAKAARDEARVKARRGEYVDRNAITVAEYLAEWIEGHAVEVKPKTLAGYRMMIRLYIEPRIGKLRLQVLRPATITKLYRDLLTAGRRNGKGLAPNTIKHVHTVLRKALSDAVIVDEILPSNPAERAKLPRTQLTEPGTVWTPAQLREFLDTAKGHRLFAFFRLAAYSGARRGELCNLRWADVDLDSPQIRLTGSSAVVEGERIEGTTKGGRSRVVSIDAGTAEILREHRKRQNADRLRLGESWKGTDDYVFTTGWGDPIYPDTVSSLMPVLIKAYNDTQPKKPHPRARLHDLRHLHATTLLLAGVPVHVVAARLGHSDPAITLRVYAHVISEQMASAAEVFASSIRNSA